ncbi:MAG: hypothetical protein IH600_15165 [Bacteroidetes bacterium]|nr:hypothetical protein [Bacteroidota bacterium]
MYRFIPFFALLLLLPVQMLRAQCSDAGACAIGAMHGESDVEVPRHQAAVRYIFGSSGKPEEISYHSILFEGSVEVFSGARVSARLPYMVVDAPPGSISGIGDLTVLWDQRLWQDDGMELRAQGGVKLPTGEDNAKGLPQLYQTGLGTTDLLLGLSLDAAPWNAAIGYQYSDGRSENSRTRLQRGDDLFARAGYRTVVNDFGLGLEVIAIQRLALSSVINLEAEGLDRFISVPGSDQLQVNLLGSASTPLADNLRLALLAAIPLLKRDVNIDGLKRALTVSVGLELGI